MKIVISKKGWLKQKYQINVIAINGENLLTSEKYYNLKDVEDTVALLKAELSTATVIYTWDHKLAA